MNTIEIDGRAYPIRYGLSGTQKVLSLVKGKTLADATKLDALNLENWPDFVKAGLDNAAKISGDDPPSREKVEAALDADIRIFHDAIRIFGEDNTPRNSTGDQSESEGN